MSFLTHNLKRLKPQSLTHSIRYYTDRSFRLANVADLAVAQEMKDKVTNEHYFAPYKKTSETSGRLTTRRDPSKQIVIDLSHEQGYRRGHIKGAVNLPLEKFDFTKKVDMFGGIHQNEVIEVMKSLGVSDDTSEIILYDNSGLLACRLFYVLRYFGFTNVRVLNGGWKAWIRSGLPVDEGIPDLPKSKSLTLKNVRTNLLKKNSQMIVDCKNRTSVVIDTRKPDAFKKVNISGSINVPIELLMQDALFTSVKEMRKILESKGIALEGKPIILYSSRGLTASVGYFCLNMVGIDSISVYDGGIYTWLHNGEETLSQEARDFLSGHET